MLPGARGITRQLHWSQDVGYIAVLEGSCTVRGKSSGSAVLPTQIIFC